MPGFKINGFRYLIRILCLLPVLCCLQVFAGPPCEKCGRYTERGSVSGYVCRYCDRPEETGATEEQSKVACCTENDAIECITCFNEIEPEKKLILYCCLGNICESCLEQWVRQIQFHCPRCKKDLLFGENCQVKDCIDIIHPHDVRHFVNKHLCLLTLCTVSQEQSQEEAAGSPPEPVQPQEIWSCPNCELEYTDSEKFYLHYMGYPDDMFELKNSDGYHRPLSAEDPHNVHCYCPYTSCQYRCISRSEQVGHVKNKHSLTLAAAFAGGMLSIEWISKLFPSVGFSPSGLLNSIIRRLVEEARPFRGDQPDVPQGSNPYLRRLTKTNIHIRLIQGMFAHDKHHVSRPVKITYWGRSIFCMEKGILDSEKTYKCHACGYQTNNRLAIWWHCN